MSYKPRTLYLLAASVVATAALLFSTPTTATNADTLNFLLLIREQIPRLETEWTTENYCDTGAPWIGITCGDNDIVTFKAADLGAEDLPAAIQLPEIPDTIIAADVQVTSMNFTGLPLVNGSLPATWSGLTQLTALAYGNAEFCGCVPESYEGVTVLTDAIDALPEEVRTKLTAADCAESNVCSAGGEDPATSTSTTTSTANPNDGGNNGGNNGGNSTVPCSVSNCRECRGGSPRLCKECNEGYSLTSLNLCTNGAFGHASVAMSAVVAAILGVVLCAL